MENLLKVLLFINVTATFSGILCNVFIAAVTVHGGQSRHFFQSPRDVLLFVLALSDAIIQSFQSLYDIVLYIWNDMSAISNICIVLLNGIYNTFVFFVSCLTAWLCCFYCIKIVSFQNKFFLLLKTKLRTLVPWVIVGTSTVSGILMAIDIGVIYLFISFETTNLSSSYCAIYVREGGFINGGFGLVTVLPFLLIVVALSCTLKSLVLHVKTSTNLNTSHFKAHIKTTKTMVLLLVLNVGFYLSQLLLTWNLFLFSSPWYWVCYVIYYLFWPLQAGVIIFMNKRLKDVCIRFFHRVHTMDCKQ